MNPPSTSTPGIPQCSYAFAIVLLIALQAIVIRADSTDGSTPLALKPGAPAGSYALGELDNINPYNGSLNFRLPLMSIGGRGSASYTMTLPIEQKWRINDTPIYLLVFDEGGNGPLPDPQVTHHYFPSANWWAGIKPGYGPGVLQGRVAQYDSQVCSDSTMRAVATLTRLTFTAPDGTEFELRDKQTDGAPAGVGLCDTTGFNRGRIFVSADGSAATFIADANIVDYIQVPNAGNDLFYPSGYLLLRDGTRYRFDNGTVTWQRDRNGNKLTFTYDASKRVTLIKDSLNREVTVSYSTASIAYDEIVYKGFGGAMRSLRVNYANLQDPGSLRAGYGIQTYSQLFPISGSSPNTNYNPKIIRSVTLPNYQQYQFQYNSYGELSRVVLPTGGAFEYDHASGVAGDASGITSGFEGSLNVYRRVVSKRVYGDGSTLESKLTFSNTESVPCTGCVVIDQFGTDGTTRISQRRLYYEGNPLNSFLLGPTEYSPWKEGRETQSEAVAANGSSVLQRAARTWQQPMSGSSWPLTQPETNAAAKSNNPQITQILTTLEPSTANKVSKQTFAFDKYTNRTDLYEYDFGTGSAGALVRRTHTDYLTSSYDTLNPSAANPDLSLTSHIRSLPTQVSVFDAGGVERARSTTEYDNYTLDGSDCLHSFHCSLLSRSNISGFDASFTAGYTKRGNPTAATRYLLSSGSVTSSITSYSQYDIAGNVIRVLDPRSTLANNIATTLEYDDRYGSPNSEARTNTSPVELTGFTSFALPTKITNALGHTTYAQFDYYLGRPVNGEDANGTVAGGYFNDALDRPTQIRRAIGTSSEGQTTFTYDDPNRVITTSSDRDTNGDNLLVSKVLFDQMGRTIETRQYEGGGNYIVTQTQYDALGRAFRTSNPFRPWQSQTAVWTTQSFDALGRVISVTTPDNASVTTSYNGNTITVTDQAGKSRKSVTDALGRLLEVYEDPSGLNYQTTYLYDVLDNLLKVTQGTQQRFFMYDSLKRLLRVRNPEQGTLAILNLADSLTGNSAWSTGYSYDLSGNLIQRTDARGVVSTYTFDALNRNTAVDYSDATPDIGRQYDFAVNGKGRVNQTWQSGNTANTTYIDSYDPLGRPLVQRQRYATGAIWSLSFQTSRSYNLAGVVTSQTYPSGHTVNFAYDAAGRANNFTGNLGDGTQRTYATGITYSQWGSLSREQFGTTAAVYHKLHYNIRGQLYDVRASNLNDEWGGELGALANYYSTNWVHGGSGVDNNGNLLMSQTIINSYYMEDRYSYDSLNRLTAVSEYQNGSTNTGSQQYTYDRWGNRTINQATWGTGINNKQFTVDTATNRLSVPAGQSGVMTYDSAGNLTNDTYTGIGFRTYDAENKMITAADNTGQTSRYTYDGDGRRVRTQIASSQEKWYVYGFDGELIAEYQASSPASAPEKEYGYRNGQLLITASGRLNVALAANGAVATASSAHTCCGFSTTGAINGNNRGPWGNGEGWNDATADSVPDWIQVDFAGSKTIDEINVFSLHDNYTQENTPTEAQTFTLYGLLAFNVQYWNGSSWVTIPGGSVTGNNKVWRKFTFSPITTSKIRVWISSVPDSWSRVVEIQAFGVSVSSEKIQWLVPDHLGTPRMVIDQSGALANVRRHDYLPFGEELFAPAGNRTIAMGYGSGDAVRQQFTSKERDTETGLDYFNARYYVSLQGRFTSFDPKSMGSKQRINPQRWNRYVYCLNSPLGIFDPDGQDGQGQGGAIVIDIFISHDSSTKDDNLTKQQQARLDSLIAAGAKKGIAVQVHDRFNATAEDADRSLATKGAVVILAGHTSRLERPDHSLGPFLGIATDSGILNGGGIIYANENNTLFKDPRTPGEPALVVALACESALLRSVAPGADNFIGVSGQPSTYGQYNAVIAAVNTIVTTGLVDPQAVRTAAENAIQNNSDQNNPDPNVRVILNPALLPPNAFEIQIRSRSFYMR